MSSWCIRRRVPFPASSGAWTTQGGGTPGRGAVAFTQKTLSCFRVSNSGALFSAEASQSRTCLSVADTFQSPSLVPSPLPALQPQSRQAVPFFDLQRRGRSRAAGGRRLPPARCEERTFWLLSGRFPAGLTFPAHLLPARPLRARPRLPSLPGVLTEAGPLPWEQQGPPPVHFAPAQEDVTGRAW